MILASIRETKRCVLSANCLVSSGCSGHPRSARNNDNYIYKYQILLRHSNQSLPKRMALGRLYQPSFQHANSSMLQLSPWICGLSILKSRLVADIQYTSQTHGFMGHLWILWDLNKSSASSSLYHFIISYHIISIQIKFRFRDGIPHCLCFFGVSLWHSGMPKNASLNSLNLSDRCLIQRPGSLEAIWCQRCRRSPTDRTPHRYLRTNPEISKGFVASECL